MNYAGQPAEANQSELKEQLDPSNTIRRTPAAESLGISETEYRLNWIPLGGYVKMLGQDDLNPNAQHEDPRAYNKKSIGARMVVVSAGVVMNVILAAVGFMVVFLMGFNTQPPTVGGVMPVSPAAADDEARRHARPAASRRSHPDVRRQVAATASIKSSSTSRSAAKARCRRGTCPPV